MKVNLGDAKKRRLKKEALLSGLSGRGGICEVGGGACIIDCCSTATQRTPLLVEVEALPVPKEEEILPFFTLSYTSLLPRFMLVFLIIATFHPSDCNFLSNATP